MFIVKNIKFCLFQPLDVIR